MFKNYMLTMFLSFIISCTPLKRKSNSDFQQDTSIDLAFERRPSNGPVVNSGVKDWPAMPSDPFVLKDQVGYHLFISVLFCKLTAEGSNKYGRPVGEYFYSVDLENNQLCDLNDTRYTIGYAFSSDKGLTWKFRTTPVFMPADGDAWDSGYNETASVVKVDDTLYLFYSGFKHDEKPRYQIGVASINLEGKSTYEMFMTGHRMFDRQGRTEPLIPKRLDSFDNNTQEPSVLFRNNQFEVYYTGLKLKDDNIKNIEGVSLGRALFDRNLNLISRPAEPFIPNKWVNIQEMIYLDSKHYLVYTSDGSGELHKGENIAYIVSSDEGRTWSASRTILSPRSTSEFDNWGLMAPTIVYDKDRFVLFYSAWQAANFKCADNPTERRVGITISEESKCVFLTMGRAEQILPNPN
jgi:predicted GH43/DUF377 family glycosyl hydrolase